MHELGINVVIIKVGLSVYIRLIPVDGSCILF